MKCLIRKSYVGWGLSLLAACVFLSHASCSDPFTKEQLKKNIGIRVLDARAPEDKRIQMIPLKQASVVKGGFLKLRISGKREIRSQFYFVEFGVNLRRNKGEIAGIAPKSAVCKVRYLHKGKPTMFGYEVSDEDVEVTGKYRGALVVRFVCKQSSKAKGPGLPKEVELWANVKPTWPRKK